MPDLHIGFLVFGLTMGMVLSLPMLAVGILMMVIAKAVRRPDGAMMIDGGPLAERLARLIAADGADDRWRLMGHAVGDYARREPFGPAGDFVTAPEISQMFGGAVGAWTLAQDAAGRPTPIRLVELGPGRGTDGRPAAHRPPGAGLPRRRRTPPRRDRAGRLRGAGGDLAGAFAATWHDRLEDVPAGPPFIVANEFFDALPIRQFAGGRRLARAGGRPRRRRPPRRASDRAGSPMRRRRPGRRRARFEIRPPRRRVMATIAGGSPATAAPSSRSTTATAESGRRHAAGPPATPSCTRSTARARSTSPPTSTSRRSRGRRGRPAPPPGDRSARARFTALGLVPRRAAWPRRLAGARRPHRGGDRLAGTGAGEMGRSSRCWR